MLRVVGAFLIFLCGVAGAGFLNSRARNALTQIEGFAELVRRLYAQIDCFSMPIPTALGSCPDAVLEKCGIDPEADRRTVADLLGSCSISSAELCEVMEDFAAHLGRGYKQEQLALCQRTLSRLEEHRALLASRLPAKQKTNGTLCMCGALAVVILIV